MRNIISFFMYDIKYIICEKDSKIYISKQIDNEVLKIDEDDKNNYFIM